MKTLALIGCSGMVYDFLYEYTKQLDVRLVAVCGTEDETERFCRMYAAPARFVSYCDMLEKVAPELVIAFPTDESMQFTVVKDCLLAGADVLCERPVCHSREEGEQLVALCRQTGHFVMPRYNRRYMPTYLAAKEIVRSKPFGRSYMYASGFHAGAYSSESAFVNNHIGHHLDLARMLLGEVSITHVERIGESDQRVGYNILFRADCGTLGVIQSNSFLCMDYPMERVEIAGNERQVVVENVRALRYNQPQAKISDSQVWDFLADGGTKALNLNNNQLNNFTFYGFEEMVREFVRCSKLHIKPLQDIEDALETYKLIETLEGYMGSMV